VTSQRLVHHFCLQARLKEHPSVLYVEQVCVCCPFTVCADQYHVFCMTLHFTVISCTAFAMRLYICFVLECDCVHHTQNSTRFKAGHACRAVGYVAVRAAGGYTSFSRCRDRRVPHRCVACATQNFDQVFVN
jgi:hypothetical protein